MERIHPHTGSLRSYGVTPKLGLSMPASLSPWPDLTVLATELQSLLPDAVTLTILHREPIGFRSSVPCEVVTCRDGAGRERRLFCKYGELTADDGPNHRHGVGYEADVYRHVLQSSHLSVPAFVGSRSDPATGAVWLILEYLEHALPLAHTPQPEAALRGAARWIADFHTEHGAASAAQNAPPLCVYDEQYYLGWVHRAAEFTRSFHERYPWLPPLFAGAAPLMRLLTTEPFTIIHGELEANNLLVKDGAVYPIDWESAAVAADVIDLANLTWGWDDEIARQCVEDYRRTRWPQGSPEDFEDRLTAARLYLACRWLGDRPEWTTADVPPVSLEEMHRLGQRARIL